MKNEGLLLQSPEQILGLRDRLANCPALSRLGSEEADTLAHGFSDIEEAMRVFLSEQLPKLADPAVTGTELEDVLLNIREEFRHILYHMHDPEFFRVVEPTHDWLQLKSQNLSKR